MISSKHNLSQHSTPQLGGKKRSYAECSLETPVKIERICTKKKMISEDDLNKYIEETQLSFYDEFDSESERISRTSKKRKKKNIKTPSTSKKKKKTTPWQFPSSATNNSLLQSPFRDDLPLGNVTSTPKGPKKAIVKFDDYIKNEKVTQVKLKPNEELTLFSLETTTEDADNCPMSPWRFDDVNVTRNPHFIQLKNSALPRLDQEMVLDYSTVEEFEIGTKNVVQSSRPRRQKSGQRKIINYFNVIDSVDTPEEDLVVSLFEDAYFKCRDDEIKLPRNEVTVSKTKQVVETKDNNNYFKLSVNVDDKKYYNKQKSKNKNSATGVVVPIPNLENTAFDSLRQENQTYLTPKVKNAGAKVQNKRFKNIPSAEEKFNKEAEKLLANLQLAYLEIDKLALDIDE